MQKNSSPLKRLLVERGGLNHRFIHSPAGSICLADIASGTSLGGEAWRLAGRSVLVLTQSQSAAALALIELDGLARRIVVGPPDLAGSALASVIADAEVEAILSDRGLELSDMPAAGGSAQSPFVLACGLPIEAAEPQADKRPQAQEPQAQEPQADELATEWVMLTSGTTGAPKMVIHSRTALTAAIKPMTGQAGPPIWATFYDIRRYGGLQIFFRALLGEGSLVLSQAGEAIGDHLIRLGAHGVTHISGTPSHWRRALMSAGSAELKPHYVRLSGEIADQAVLDSLARAYPRASIGHAYASTEAGVGFEVTDGLEGFPASFLGLRGDVEMKIEAGSLRIRSTRTASRYIGPAEDRAPLADRDGFIDTDDMIEQRGERCHFVGRRSGIINVGGLKVHPEEVEAVINRHGGVRMSLVKGRSNPITGAVAVADIVLKDEVPAEARGAALKDEILGLCRAALPYHKVPVLIRFIPALDVTPAGKLSRSHA